MRLCQILLLVLLFPAAARADVGQDLALWEAQRSNPSPNGGAVAYLAQTHPDWPGLTAMAGKVEANRAYGGLDAAGIAALFKARRPSTADGMAAYIKALGNSPQARSELKDIWRTELLNKDTQRMVLERFGAMLDQQDHQARLDLLLDNDYPLQATEMALAAGGNATSYALTRIGIKKGEIKSTGQIPSAFKNDARVLGEFLRFAADKDDVSGGMSIARAMNAVPANAAAYQWKARHRLAREALEQGRKQDAYFLVSTAGTSKGAELAESEFLAGFIALRMLNNPRQAIQHFNKMYQGVESVISKSRAAYWAGRSASAAGDQQLARQWFQAASRYPTTFFGQRAYAAMEQPMSRNVLNAHYQAGSDKFGAQESLLSGASYFYQKRNEEAARAFLLAGANKAGSASDYNKLYDVARRYNDRHIAVKIARKQGVTGLTPPMSGFPELRGEEREQARAGGMTNMALVAGIVRQESEFDTMALSPAGAQGMMQLMPATARETARKMGISHQQDWLRDKPQHNIRLGSAYLAQLLQRYNGSPVLAIAAYNAGPGRVAQWLERFGDPRTNEVATEDWIELIPISETRNYIQRVQEGEMVYRQL